MLVTETYCFLDYPSAFLAKSSANDVSFFFPIVHITCSFVPYDLSNPNKYGVPQVDLSADSEAAISDAMKLTPCQLV